MVGEGGGRRGDVEGWEHGHIIMQTAVMVSVETYVAIY